MESKAIVSRKSTWPMRCSTCTQEAQLFSIVGMGHWGQVDEIFLTTVHEVAAGSLANIFTNYKRHEFWE
jgi:hypothetical protein